MVLVSALLSKLTLEYIAEVVATSSIKYGTTSAIKNIPKIKDRLENIFGDTKIPLDNHLEKAIKIAQWLGLKVIVEKMYSIGEMKDSYPNLNQTIQKVTELLEKGEFTLNYRTTDSNEVVHLFINDNEIKNNFVKKISDLFLEELDASTGNIKKLADYNLLKNHITNGWKEEKLNWLDLVIAFFKNSLLGDNNLAKDAFQNQTLSEIRLQMSDFNNYADECINRLGKEVVNEFKSGFIEIKGEIAEFKNDILEKISDLIPKSINLELFPEPKALAESINIISKKIKAIETKINETKGFLKGSLTSEIKNRFEEDIKELENSLSIEIKKINETEEELEHVKLYIRNAWKAINSVNSARLEKAKIALENGNLAILENILKEEEIDKDYKEIVEQENIFKEKKEIIAKEYLTRGYFILALKKDENWLTEATRNFVKASNISLSPNTLFEIANFYKDYNLPVDAINFYKKSIQLNPNLLIKSQIFNNLGIIYRSLDEFKNAENSYYSSIEIKKLLAEENPKDNLIYLVNSLINFGVFYAHYNINDKAKNNFKDALDFLERLEIEFELDVLKEYADVFNNLAIIAEREISFKIAIQAFIESIRLKRICLSRNNENWMKVSLSDSLINLGNLFLNIGKIELAAKNYQEGFEILIDITSKEPYKFDSNLGICLIGFANFQIQTNNSQKAKQFLNEALEVFTKINFDHKFDLQIAIIYSNIGSIKKHLQESTYYDFINKSNDLINKMNPEISLVKELKTLNNQILAYHPTSTI